MSPSSRGRGLKFALVSFHELESGVALFTRAWIEIRSKISLSIISSVALFTRAWIEIYDLAVAIYLSFVALFTRAWIEIFLL